MAQLNNDSMLMKQRPEELIPLTWLRIRVVILIGLVLVLFVSFYCSKKTGCCVFFQTLYTFGSGMLIGGAAFAVGGIGGFIFGIPSMNQKENSDNSFALKYNDNLIQISDWLTKIIVGVGLVQLYKIPREISNLGDSLKSNFGDDPFGKNASLAIVFYFLLFGFLIIYFWTRTDFTTIIKVQDDTLKKKLAAAVEKLENTEKEKNIAEFEKRKFEKLADTITANKSNEFVSLSPDASTAYDLTSFKDEIPEATVKDSIDKLKEKVQEVLRNKSVIKEDDLQKGKWGGKSENNGKQITAKVEQSKVQNFYDIIITVSATPNQLDVPVAIFVHDSFQFPNDVIYVKPGANGVAEIKLSAYEAFTVGALFADGTELELDLNDQPGYPAGFYWGKNNTNMLA